METYPFDEKFKCPTTIMVAAPTKAGKSTLVRSLLSNTTRMFYPPPEEIIWYFSESQPSYNLANVKYRQGTPNTQDLRKGRHHKLIVLDDMMGESRNLTEIFTQGCHHWNVTIIFIVQDVFYDKKRTNRINCQYIILMKSPGDKLTALNLAKQMFPTNTKYFMDAYQKATEKPHGYLLIDLEQNTPEILRLRSCILPGETTIVYVPK